MILKPLANTDHTLAEWRGVALIRRGTSDFVLRIGDSTRVTLSPEEAVNLLTVCLFVANRSEELTVLVTSDGHRASAM